MELPRTKIAVLAPFSTATGSRARAARFERAFLGLAGAITGVGAIVESESGATRKSREICSRGIGHGPQSHFRLATEDAAPVLALTCYVESCLGAAMDYTTRSELFSRLERDRSCQTHPAQSPRPLLARNPCTSSLQLFSKNAVSCSAPLISIHLLSTPSSSFAASQSRSIPPTGMISSLPLRIHKLGTPSSTSSFLSAVIASQRSRTKGPR